MKFSKSTFKKFEIIFSSLCCEPISETAVSWLNDPGFFFIYLAKKLEKCEDKKEDYQIEIQEIDFDKVYKMVLNNEIVDGKTSLGVLLCKDIIN